MTATLTIRAARVQLAQALLESSHGVAEAGELLRGALREPGDNPPDWQIHYYLGAVEQRSGSEPVASMSEALAATVAAPAADAEDPARLALEILDNQAGRQWATRLDEAQVRSLVSRARSDGVSSLVINLAARLSLMLGDLETAGSLISSISAAEVRADPAIGTAQAVTRALDLIDYGRYEEAVTLLDERESIEHDPAAAAPRALALYGLGDLDAALAAAGAAPQTFATAMAQALVWLRRAGEKTGYDSAVDPVAHASNAASTAARLDPAQPDALLMRAQVELEGTLDIATGRRLLERALHRLDGDLETSRMWRVQRAVRQDDAFRYVRLEVAAACAQSNELMAVSVGDLPFQSTDFRQDAAIANLVGSAFENEGHAHEAAGYFELAGRFYTNVDDLEPALEARRAAVKLGATPDRLLQLADDLWQASYRRQEQGVEVAERVIDEGLHALDRLAEWPAEMTPAHWVDAAYQRGLLLARRAARGGGSLPEVWRPLPWLLTAALHDPEHSYRAAHLAWALDEANLPRPALHFAERAYSLGEWDAWLQECLIVMYSNWYGVLDERTYGLLDTLGYESWGSTMRESDALNRNDVERLATLMGHEPADATWARQLRAEAMARVNGIGAAEELYRALLEEALRAPVNYLVACDCALMLRDADSARRYLEEGASRQMLTSATTQFRDALIKLIQDHEPPVDHLRTRLRGIIVPAGLRYIAYCTLPILAMAWTDKSEAVQVLEDLQREAEERLGALEALPPLTAELEWDGGVSGDKALEQLVRELLTAEEQGGIGSAEGAATLRGLADDQLVPTELGPAFAALVAKAPS